MPSIRGTQAVTRYRARLIANTPFANTPFADAALSNTAQSFTLTGADIRRLQLQVEGDYPDFHSGQYLGLLSPDGTPVFFSIASLPSELPLIELHYAATPGSPDVARMDAILAAPMLEFTAPAGSTGLFAVPDAKAVLLAAAATGIAQALAIVRSWAAEQSARQRLAHQQPGSGAQPSDSHATLRLYWGVRTADQLYCANVLDELANTHAGFSWVPVVSEQPSSAGGQMWAGRQGLLVDAVLADEQWRNTDVFFISGGPAMVLATAQRLREAGVAADRLRSDLL